MGYVVYEVKIKLHSKLNVVIIIIIIIITNSTAATTTTTKTTTNNSTDSSNVTIKSVYISMENSVISPY
jgi:hypothetical protein